MAQEERPKASKTALPCREPETLTQRAWLKTWQEARTRGEKQKPALKLVEIFLSGLSNSGSVDRFLGLCKLTLLRRGHVDRGGVEAAMKLLTQDQGGRRRTAFNPKASLTEMVPKQTAGGGIVQTPASDFCLRAMRLYARWYGTRKCPGRSLQPGNSLVAQLRASKPRLACHRSEDGKSEKHQLQQHASSVKAAVARVEAGGLAEGPLGPVHLPKKSQKTGDEITSQAEASFQLSRKKRERGSASSIDPAAEAKRLKSEAIVVDAVDQQRLVWRQREEAMLAAEPGKPVAYIDAQGFRMRPKLDEVKVKKQAAPSLPSEPSLHRAKSLQKVQCPTQFRRPLGGELPNVVAVEDLVADWDSAEGLLARLAGARLVDKTWMQHFPQEPNPGKAVCFARFLGKHELQLLLSESFQQQRPEHVKILEACAAQSSTAKKPFVVHTGSLAKPTHQQKKCYLVTEAECDSAEAFQTLSLQELLLKCGKIFAK